MLLAELIFRVSASDPSGGTDTDIIGSVPWRARMYRKHDLVKSKVHEQPEFITGKFMQIVFTIGTNSLELSIIHAIVLATTMFGISSKMLRNTYHTTFLHYTVHNALVSSTQAFTFSL